MNTEDLSVVRLAYIAGYLDGEGCFTVHRNQIRIYITNTYLPALQRLKEEFGGYIRKVKKRPNRRAAYVWQVSSKKAFAVCIQVMPYLKEKKVQVQLLIDYQKTMGYTGREVPESIREGRKRISDELRRLKHLES